MALKSNALISLAVAKDYLDIQVSDTTQDTRVERLINMASQFISEYCDRNFITGSYVDYQDGRKSNQILLRQWPATKPTDLRVDSSWAFGTDTIIDPAEYDIVEDMFVVLRNTFFPNGYRNIKVTYTAGYGTIGGNNLPSDIQEACLELVALYQNKRTDRRIGVQSKSKQGENITYIEDVPEDILSLLQNYKRYEFSPANVGIANG